MHRYWIGGLAALALGLALSPDGRFAAVTHSGWHAKGLDLVDLESASRTQHVPLAETWLGVAFIDGGRTLAVSAGHTNRVLLFPIRDGRAGTADTIVVGPPWTAGGQRRSRRRERPRCRRSSVGTGRAATRPRARARSRIPRPVPATRAVGR